MINTVHEYHALKRITILEVYHKNLEEVYNDLLPTYEAVDFRPPRKGDLFLGVGSAYTLFRDRPSCYDFPQESPRIILKRKELSFGVGDCFKVTSPTHGTIIGYARVVQEDTDKSGRLIFFEKLSTGWTVVDNQMGSLQRTSSRREISRREFDALFIEKIVNRCPA